MKNYYPTLCLIIGFISFYNFSYGQQLPIFTQYREYHSFINPASISNDYMMGEYNLQTGASYRTHASDIDGTPTSIFLRGEYILRTKGSFDLSFGGYALGYNTDPFKTNGAYGKVAALFTKDPFYGAFSIGLTFGAMQYSVDVGGLRPFHINDAIITASNQTATAPDVGIGAFYYKQFRDGLFAGDVFYAGLSMPQILGSKAMFDDGSTAFSYQQERHIFAQGGYYKYFDELSFLHPSIWIKYVPTAPLHIDVNVQYQYKQNLWGGVGFSTSKIVHLELGTYINASSQGDKNRFKIGYGFDYSLGDLNDLLGTAHEINLSFFMDTRKKNK